MRFVLFFVLINCCFCLVAQYSEKQNGIIVANGEEHQGLIALNLESNTVLLDEGTQNRMFHEGIEKVTIDQSRDTYVMASFNGEKALFRMVVTGSVPLLERFDLFFSYLNEELIQLGDDEKVFFSVFGRAKKDIKDYAFVRNISSREPGGIANIFEYYNKQYAK
ncbi:MAG: hypothetical protein AAGA66_15235 [Bacteroidota bacterium]